MSIITDLNQLRRECKSRGVPGPHTYAIPAAEVPAAAAEIATVMNSTKPRAQHVAIETVEKAIHYRQLTILDCRVIVAEVVGR